MDESSFSPLRVQRPHLHFASFGSGLAFLAGRPLKTGLIIIFPYRCVSMEKTLSATQLGRYFMLVQIAWFVHTQTHSPFVFKSTQFRKIGLRNDGLYSPNADYFAAFAMALTAACKPSR